MGVKLLLAGWYGGDGLFSAPEAPWPWLRRVERWVREAAEEMLESSRTVEGPRGPILFLSLHPAAEEVAIVAAGQGRVVVLANTSMVGPGYHRYLCDLLHALAGEVAHEGGGGVGGVHLDVLVVEGAGAKLGAELLSLGVAQALGGGRRGWREAEGRLLGRRAGAGRLADPR